MQTQVDEFFHAAHLVLLLQCVERGKAFLYLFQSFGTEFYAVGFLTDFLGDVLHLDVARLDAIRHFIGRFQLVADAAQGSHRLFQLLQKRFLSFLLVFASIDASFGIQQFLLDFLGML